MELGSEDGEMEQIANIFLQIVAVPLVGFIFHVYSKRSVAVAEDKKKIVDLERAITKQERDRQYIELKNEDVKNKVEVENKVNQLRTETQHSIEEINQTLASYKNMLDRIFAKLDKIEDNQKRSINNDK